jgi:hypothetical protein
MCATISTRCAPSAPTAWPRHGSSDRHTEELHCTTLDAVLADRSEPYHVLKIDAQGAERQILEGAADYLSGGDCLALHLELFRVPLYEGIALRPEVEEFVEGMGFSLVKEYPPQGSFDSQNDCVFLRRGAVGPVVDAIRAAIGADDELSAFERIADVTDDPNCRTNDGAVTRSAAS